MHNILPSEHVIQPSDNAPFASFYLQRGMYSLLQASEDQMYGILIDITSLLSKLLGDLKTFKK